MSPYLMDQRHARLGNRLVGASWGGRHCPLDGLNTKLSTLKYIRNEASSLVSSEGYLTGSYSDLGATKGACVSFPGGCS